ncbi:MAG: ATP12 family protein [Alphaproteobacteria bacterium]
MKRFYDKVAVAPTAAGFAVELDGRPIRTPKKAAFAVPGEAVAAAIAEEWRRQGDKIEPEGMPLSRLANTAIDMIAGQRDAVVDNLAGFGQTDLLCYRAEGPAELVLRQEQRWSPWLDWAASRHGARLATTHGLDHIVQEKDALAALRRAVDGHDIMELAALNDLVTIAGSLVLGLAVSGVGADVSTAWAAARLDNEFQAEKWGRDAEAEAYAARLREEFEHAANFLNLHRVA